MAREPVPAAHRRLETFAALLLQVPGQHAVHDLALIEDHRLAPGLAEMPRKGAVRMLNRELPVDDAIGARDEVRALERAGGREEGLDDIAARFGIARQPAVLEAPARGHAARIGETIPHVLGAA